MPKKTDTDSGLPRKQPDPDQTVQITRPICGMLEKHGDQSYVCLRDPDHEGGHTPTAVTTDAVRAMAARYGHVDSDIPTEVSAAASPRDGDPDDPAPAAPEDSGPGRSDFDTSENDAKLIALQQQVMAARPVEIVRPDAAHSVVAALMARAVPAQSDEFAIKHADQLASMVEVAQASGRIWNRLTDELSPQLAEARDLRTVYRNVRKMAAAAGIDLDDPDGDR